MLWCRRRNERYWLLIEYGDTEICKTYRGLDADLYITAEAEAFVIPTWNARSAFAHIKPISRTAASSTA